MPNPFRQNNTTSLPNKRPTFGGTDRVKSHNGAKHLSQREKEWGQVKFTPTVRTQPATPWSQFKNDIIQTQREETNALNCPDMNSEEGKQILKKREENYRRALITEKQKEVTLWEDFSAKPQPINASSAGSRKNKKNGSKKRKQKQEQETEMPSKRLAVEQNANKKSEPWMSKDELKQFDSKKLTFKQNNTLRKAITKTTNLARGATLEGMVKDLKYRGIKRKANNSNNTHTPKS